MTGGTPPNSFGPEFRIETMCLSESAAASLLVHACAARLVQTMNGEAKNRAPVSLRGVSMAKWVEL